MPKNGITQISKLCRGANGDKHNTQNTNNENQGPTKRVSSGE